MCMHIEVVFRIDVDIIEKQNGQINIVYNRAL